MIDRSLKILAIPSIPPWEGDWLRYLLGPDFSNQIENADPAADIGSHDCLLITNYQANYRPMIHRLIAHDRRFAVILLSDEHLQDPTEYIDDPHCAFVARNYVHPANYQHPRMLNFGLGYRAGFNVNQNSVRPSTSREYVWNFMGSIHCADRALAIQSFADVGPNFLHRTRHFNSPDYLSVDQYREVMEQSQFTLCPRGHTNIDSFRICEALEAGSIPVVLNHAPHFVAMPSYWHFLFMGDHRFPFVIATSWDDAKRQVREHMEAGRVDDVQAQCRSFWQRWKSTWKTRLRSRLLDMTT